MQCISKTTRTIYHVVSLSVFSWVRVEMTLCHGSCQGAQPRRQHYLHELRKQVKIYKYIYIYKLFRDDFRGAQNGFFWFYTIGKGPCKGIIENQEIREVGFQRRTPRGRVESKASRFLENRGVGIVELCGSRLNSSPCLMTLFGKDGEILSGTSGFSKTFPEVPIEFRAPCGNPESPLNICLGRAHVWDSEFLTLH